MKTHKLKAWIPYWEEVFLGIKTFDIRPNNRDYKVSDYVELQEFNQETQEFTGRRLLTQIIYISKEEFFGINEGYCGLGLKLISETRGIIMAREGRKRANKMPGVERETALKKALAIINKKDINEVNK